MCRWHRVGACRFGHSDESELPVQHDGLGALSVEVQELRSGLRRLAAHVVWHNAAVVGSQQEPAGERSSARTSGTTPSSAHQATGGVQWVTSPQKAASSTKRRGGEDSDDEKWFSGDEDDDSVSRTHEGPEPVVTETLEVVESIPKERISERTSECTVEHFVGVPVPQIQERTLEFAEITPQKRIPERIVGQIDDVPVPQILNEIVEVVKAVKSVPQERISEKIGEQIDDDIVSVDQPGDQARCDTQACGDAEKVPQIRTVLKTVEIPPAKFVDRVMDAPRPRQVMAAVKRVTVAPTGAPSLMD